MDCATTNATCAAVAAMPIGTTSKVTKLLQNARFAAPSRTWTAIAKHVPEPPAVVRGDGEEQESDQEGEPMVLDPADGVRRVVEDGTERTGAGVVPDEFERHLRGSDHGEEHAVDQHHRPARPPRQNVGIVGPDLGTTRLV